jgi:anaphase-promoting complex subunit 3
MDAIDWLEVEPVVEALFGILRVLGSGFNHLCQYRCKEAFDTFALVSPEHYNTGWVLCQVARAQFEMAEYRRSEQLFLQARELEPYRVDDMEVFSVALWHLHKEVELSYLAHDLVELDKKRPQAWCAVGNSFSLKQEHDLALKCFQRAIQLDPQFAYAYTLAGHEYIANEDLDTAQGSFRNALRVDERHYNSWYWLGYLFYRQVKLQMAKFHFESALMINKDSPILTYYIGMVGLEP